MPRIYVGGVNGCGKTAACGLIRQRRSDVIVFTASELMMKAAGVTTREELAQMSRSEKDRISDDTFVGLYETTPNLIIDAHFNLTAADTKYFDQFVLVTASVDDIKFWRSNDVSRKRSLDPDIIRRELADLNSQVADLEAIYKIKVVRVANDRGLIDLADQIEEIYNACEANEPRREIDSKYEGRRL